MHQNERLYPLRYHAMQDAYDKSQAKYNVVPAGRRSGKTEKAKRKLIRKVFEPKPWPNPRYFAGAPTAAQARQIYWEDLKAMLPSSVRGKKPSESRMEIYLCTGAMVAVIGMDKPQRIEGAPWDGGILDEYADMKPEAWGANVQPALADRDGWCDLIGVPEGRNHYHTTYEYARDSGDPDWAAFTWRSAEILPPHVIERARRSLDPLTFDQEYNASFVNFEGRAYYPFLHETHTSTALAYDDRAALIFCFDFNVEPGIAVVCQEQRIPGQYERNQHGVLLLDRPIYGTGVIGEVWIPRNSNTPAVCRKLLADWGKHQGPVRVYGDATGGARGTAKVAGSDWDIIRAMLRDGYQDGEIKVDGFGTRATFHVPSANPAERSRVNAMNTRLLRQDSTIHLMVDPKAAPHVVRDLEGVTTLKGGSGELDKDSNKELTHISDALGYYVHKEFPINNNKLGRAALGGT